MLQETPFGLVRPGPYYVILEGVPPSVTEGQLAHLCAAEAGFEKCFIYNVDPRVRQFAHAALAIFQFSSLQSRQPHAL